MKQILLYAKHFKNANGGSFEKLFSSYNGIVIEASLTKISRPKLEAEKLNWPIKLDLDEKDYFIKNKFFKKKDGTEGMKQVLMILDFQNAEQGEFKKTTLDDLVAEEALKA